MAEGAGVELDVHARRVVAGVLDGESGELRSLRAPVLSAAPDRSGLRTLPL